MKKLRASIEPNPVGSSRAPLTRVKPGLVNRTECARTVPGALPGQLKHDVHVSLDAAVLAAYGPEGPRAPHALLERLPIDLGY